jgi:hypothetical protein
LPVLSLPDTKKLKDPKYWSHMAKLLGGAASHVVDDTVGILGDAIDPAQNNPFADIKELYYTVTGDEENAKKAFKKSREKSGRVSRAAARAHDKVFGEDEQPQTPAEKYIYAATRGAASSLPYLVMGPLGPTIASGVGAGVASQAAADAGGGEAAQLAAGLVGGIAGGHVGNVPKRASAARTIVRGASHPDYPVLIRTVLELEGGGTITKPKTSPKGAKGPMQVMPGTSKDPGYGIRPSNGTPADDVRVGNQYFAAMLGKYKGDPEKALAAYNWGPGNLDKAIKKHGDDWYYHAPSETQNYVAKGMNKTYGGPRSVSVGDEGVPPMAPEDMARAMGEDPSIYAEDDNVVPFSGKFIDAKLADNVVEGPDGFYMYRNEDGSLRDLTPEEQQAHFDTSVERHGYRNTVLDDFDELTPAERQEMDASAEMTPMDSSHEKFTGYIDEPAKPANDAEGYRNLSDLTREEWARIEKSQEPLIYDESIGDYRNETSEEKITRHEEIDARYAGGNDNIPPGGDGPPPPGDEPPPPPMTDRLIAAIQEAQPIRNEQARAHSRERAKRFEKLAQTQKFARGEEGLRVQLSDLAGDLPKVDFEGVRGQFTPEEIDQFFDHVYDYPALPPVERTNAAKGLKKLFGEPEGTGRGVVPTEHELDLLGQIFGKELTDALLKKRAAFDQVKDVIANVLNIPRALMTSADLSAPFRQGIFLVGRKEFYTSFEAMFKQISKQGFREVQDEIASRPTYPLMEKARLSLTKVSRNLSEREEAFMSEFAERIPGIGKIVGASNRAYIGFLNKLRADTFDSIVRDAERAGVDIEHDPRFLKDLGNFINNATGRGNLGAWNQAAPVLSGALFSPRLIASRVRMLSPQSYLDPRIHPLVRKEAAKALVSFTAMGLTALGLAVLGGAKTSFDPRSSDFGKIVIGKSHYDIWGGFQQFVRLAASIMPNSWYKGMTGKKPDKRKSQLDAIETFAEGKASPNLSFLFDAWRGRDLTGQKFDITRGDRKNPVLERFIPLVSQDIMDAAEEYGPVEGTMRAAPSAVGIGVSTYTKRKPQSKPKKDEEF